MKEKRKINVLVVSSKYPPEYSGSGLRAHNTYKRLQYKFNINFKVISSSVTDNANCDYEWDGVEVKRISNKIGARKEIADNEQFILKFIKAIYNKFIAFLNYVLEAPPTFLYLLKNRQFFDIIHVFGNVNVTSAAITYAKVTKTPLIIELVNLVENPRYLEPFLIQTIFGKGFPSHALIVAISQKLREACLKNGYPDKQIWCRPNPVDETRFFFNDRPNNLFYHTLLSSNSSSNSEENILILHLAKFMPRKNQFFMVEVAALLPKKYNLILAGPIVDRGPLANRDFGYFQLIKERIHHLGLEKRVKVIPKFIEYPEKLIHAANVFVLPSVQEGLGTPVLESLACGVPVVVNNIPGVFDQWIQEGINGYICNLNPSVWAERIEQSAKMKPILMEKTSKEILRVASTETIDNEYYLRLNQLLS